MRRLDRLERRAVIDARARLRGVVVEPPIGGLPTPQPPGNLPATFRKQIQTLKG